MTGGGRRCASVLLDGRSATSGNVPRCERSSDNRDICLVKWLTSSVQYRATNLSSGLENGHILTREIHSRYDHVRSPKFSISTMFLICLPCGHALRDTPIEHLRVQICLSVWDCAFLPVVILFPHTVILTVESFFPTDNLVVSPDEPNWANNPAQQGSFVNRFSWFYAARREVLFVPALYSDPVRRPPLLVA